MSRDAIVASAWTIDHDVALMEHVLGEASLAGRLVLYCDGAEGYLCTWPLTGPLPVRGDEVRDAIDLVRAKGAVRLHVWGPEVEGLHGALPSVPIWYVRVPREFDCVMRIALQEAEIASPPQRRRRSKGRPRLRLSFVDGFPGLPTMTALSRPYQQRPGLDRVQHSIIAAATSVDLYSSTTSFVAMKDEVPAGVIVSHLVDRDVAIIRWALFDPSVVGVSSYLFRVAAVHLKGLGARVMDLGYGGSPTLYAYKRKLGAEPLGRPIRRSGFMLS